MHLLLEVCLGFGLMLKISMRKVKAEISQQSQWSLINIWTVNSAVIIN